VRVRSLRSRGSKPVPGTWACSGSAHGTGSDRSARDGGRCPQEGHSHVLSLREGSWRLDQLLRAAPAARAPDRSPGQAPAHPRSRNRALVGGRRGVDVGGAMTGRVMLGTTLLIRLGAGGREAVRRRVTPAPVCRCRGSRHLVSSRGCPYPYNRQPADPSVATRNVSWL
jgi:hypothetical protein